MRPMVIKSQHSNKQACIKLIKERLVCAYLIGWQVGRDTFPPALPLAEREDQVGCFVSYTTMADGHGVETMAGGRQDTHISQS